MIEFPPNTPVTVALKYGQGKTISSQYGERIMFTTVDNRVMFLDFEVAEQIIQLGVNVREPFLITQQWDGRKDSPRIWKVERPPAPVPAMRDRASANPAGLAGEQPDGTFAVPKLAPPAAMPKPPARATSANSSLVNEANALVDAFAEVLARALTTYEGRIKPDEVRALLISAYIQRTKLSSVA